MFKKLNDIQTGSIVAFVIFLLIFSNYYLNTGSQMASCFCITIGIALGFYFFLENKILPIIFSGILISHVISRLVFSDWNFYEILFTSASQAAVDILVIYIIKRISISMKIFNNSNFKNAIIFIITILLVSMLAGVLITNIMSQFNNSIEFITPFIKWSSGYFFGILIFGIAIILSNYYNEGFESIVKNAFTELIFLLVFIILSSILFSNYISWFSYSDFSYIFVVFYLVLSIVFSFKMIVITDILFVILYQFFFIKTGNNVAFSYIILNINLYLLILSTLAVSMKMIIYEFNYKNAALKESSVKLESLVYSTESLLKLSDDILDTDTKVHEDYLSRIFRIACNIFSNYDYASCYIKEGEFLNFVDTSGYDIEILNSFSFESKNLEYVDTENPIHFTHKNKSISAALGDKYEAFNKIYPKMSETIRFGIYIDTKTIANISFDISEDSGKKFLKNEFENLKSFQKLMNSFFSINYLNYKNISLKNDIVLSLIRTLELYDQYTGGHSEEVAYLSNEIAKRCGLDENTKHDIYWAGVVHDIGKVGIDSAIINKPSKLSLEEYETIKQHPVFGYEILNKSEDLKTIAILVKHHHEWWNGAGYPSGLKGDNIPFGSQIISICDAVSTMAKKRPYTIVKSSKEILEELKMYSGVQFSPIPTKHMMDFIKEGLLDKYYKNR